MAIGLNDMITEDYILKLIRLATEFVVKALGLAKEGDFLTSEKTLENGLQDLTGISIDTLKTLEAESLMSILSDNRASIFVIAQFLGTLAEVEKQKGMLDLYYIYLKKALRLYLSIHMDEDLETDGPIIETYSKTRDTIYDSDLLVELLEFFKSKGDAGECDHIALLLAE